MSIYFIFYLIPIICVLICLLGIETSILSAIQLLTDYAEDDEQKVKILKHKILLGILIISVGCLLPYQTEVLKTLG